MNASASRDRFYFISFIAMAVLCLGGFVPTFYLRPEFFDDPLPVWMNFHGVLMTLWYLIAITQSWLILKNKQSWHRQLGIAAAVVCAEYFHSYIRRRCIPASDRGTHYRRRAIQYHHDIGFHVLCGRRHLLSP